MIVFGQKSTTAIIPLLLTLAVSTLSTTNNTSMVNFDDNGFGGRGDGWC